MVVENRPGGGTMIGTEAAARAAPDGNTVLLVANSFVVNPALKKGNYDPLTSFEPVCQLAATPMVLVVKGDSPYRTVADLIAAARAKPGELSLASGGPASSLHFAFEVLKRAANINMTYVPYGGTAPVDQRADGRARDVGVRRLSDGGVAAQIRHAARARSPPRRRASEALPDVPTFAEAGLTKYEADIFYGIVAPAKTPPDAVAQLSGWFTRRHAGARGEAQARAAGAVPGGQVRRAISARILRGLIDDYTRVAARGRHQGASSAVTSGMSGPSARSCAAARPIRCRTARPARPRAWRCAPTPRAAGC